MPHYLTKSNPVSRQMERRNAIKVRRDDTRLPFPSKVTHLARSHAATFDLKAVEARLINATRSFSWCPFESPDKFVCYPAKK
jgi:hypothetical protein